jgi:Lrp/AsnC family leucine-responsive transcriptional regulator
MANIAEKAFKLDKKDKDLLSLLYLNSRASFTELGKKLNLSSSSVERRMKQLKGAGVISLLFADVNFSKLGYNAYRIYMKFDSLDSEKEKEILTIFEEYSRTTWGVICEGAYDVLWRIHVNDIMKVEEAVNMMTEKFGKHVIEKTVVTTTYQTYLSWNRALGGERHPEFPLERVTEIEKPDEKDMQILAMLYDNARATSVELASKTGLSPDAVNYRIKNLTKNGFILGYSAWFDAKKLGMEYYKVLIGFRGLTQEKEKRFLDFCCEHNNVIFVNKAIGSWDIEVDVLVDDVVELHRFISDIKTKFGNVIGRHVYVAAIEERMLNPIREFLPKEEKVEKL